MRTSSSPPPPSPRERIIAAALELFGDLAYEEVSLNAIAREAGISKPVVYRHFRTREEIFLQIYFEVAVQWLERLRERAALLTGEVEKARALAELIVGVSREIPLLGRLAPLLSISIERNVSEEAIYVFKSRFYSELRGFSAVLGGLFPGLEGRAAFSLMALIHALLASFFASQANLIVNKVMARPEFELWQIDWEAELQRAIRVLIEEYSNGVQAD